MDIRDLMLGDLVQVNGEVFKVISVSYFDIGISDSKEDFYQEHIDNIEPIPLTPEILEKNGFRKESYIEVVGGLDTYYLGEEIGSFRIHRLQEGYYQFGLAKINFVHQLQHALRLCNISKKIEL